MEASIKREMAMDPARDVILAYMQTGSPLSPDHGFPVRVIIPGFIGGRMVKWLKRIVFTAEECDGHYHYKDNRVLPSHVDAELANEEEYIINELNINSVITTPCHDEILPINSWTMTRGLMVVRGYAYSGGGRKVTRVEVTLDGGETCTGAGPAGAKEIAVRAWDEALNTRPENLIWNVML
ncbi:Oxidoreductase, molybdopterin-binding domain [Sesbania bispinosa]|nr:Oxidoreductase, molybdopterin-binding domain [Sesbania bispinosa]